MLARVPVLEIMTERPVTVHADISIAEAAVLMKDRGVGSLVVLEGENPVGIVTERDMVTKVIAQRLSLTETKMRDVMSTPLVSIHPHTEVAEAASKMAKLKIRRLAIVDGGKLVGLVTENDIIHLWPQLIEVTREYTRAGLVEKMQGVEGYCEACNIYSTDLRAEGSLLVCPECRER
jgi:CBS domain-containing protein